MARRVGDRARAASEVGEDRRAGDTRGRRASRRVGPGERAAGSPDGAGGPAGPGAVPHVPDDLRLAAPVGSLPAVPTRPASGPEAATLPEPAPLWLKVEEVAGILRLPLSTAYEYVRCGQIPSVKLGKHRRIHRSWLEDIGRYPGPPGRETGVGGAEPDASSAPQRAPRAPHPRRG